MADFKWSWGPAFAKEDEASLPSKPGEALNPAFSRGVNEDATRLLQNIKRFHIPWVPVEGIVSTGSVLLPLSCLKGSRESSSKKVIQLTAHLKFLYPNVCIVGYKQELKSLVEKIIEIQAICYHGNVLGRIAQLEDCNQEPQAVYKC